MNKTYFLIHEQHEEHEESVCHVIVNDNDNANDNAAHKAIQSIVGI